MHDRPNFFIVGAPKSGTTALYEYLRGHPRIFLPAGKEPHYFATDYTEFPRVQSEAEYLALFRRSDERYLAVGEASAGYLYSKEAIRNIHAFNPAAHIIAMLRNPVDLVYSMHAQALYNFNEDEPDFETAWYMQDERREGRNIPAGCRAWQFLQYQALGSLGQQVERLYGIFPRQQVMLLFFDDFVADTKASYESVLEFLGVPTDERRDFPSVNESKTHRSRLLGWLTQTPPRPVITTVRLLRSYLGLDINPLLAGLRRMNDVKAARAPLDPALRRELQSEFAADVRLLGTLAGRDLSAWLR